MSWRNGSILVQEQIPSQSSIVFWAQSPAGVQFHVRYTKPLPILKFVQMLH